MYVFKLQAGPGGFNFYCASASRTDPSVCPPNHDAIMVLVPCPLLPVTSNKVTQSHHLNDIVMHPM
jgi:hypothetical protein